MLASRIIPCLQIRDRALTKTVQFSHGRYLGDPLNAIRIFNGMEVDELIVLEIDATLQSRPPDLRSIEGFAAECRMPLCYGGGVKSVEQAKAILALGVEKVAVSASALLNTDFVRRLSDSIGSQSVVVILDYRREKSGHHNVYIESGRRSLDRTVMELARLMQSQGAGEIVLNSIERDGTMSGYDLDLVREINAELTIPITALGGAGCPEHIRQLVSSCRYVGAAAASMFLFKGPLKAPLISYLSSEEKRSICEVTQDFN